MRGGADRWVGLHGLIQGLLSDPALIDEVTDMVRASVPALADLAPDEVAAHVGPLVTAALRAVDEGRPPTREDLALAEALGKARAEGQVSVADMLSGIHAGHLAVWHRARRLAGTEAVDPQVILEAMLAEAGWAHDMRVAALAAHRTAESTRARRARDRQAAALRALVQGEPVAAELAELRRAHLDPDGGLWCLRTRSDHLRTVDALAGELAPATAMLAGRLEDELVAVVDRPPATVHRSGRRGGETKASDPREPRGGVIGAVAGPVSAEGLPGAYRLAGRALAAARAVGRRGWWRPGQMALDIVVHDDPELGDVVLLEHLGALDAADPRAAVLVQTLVTWLDRGQRLDPTARALTVHPNTVRHRLGRLAALTGLAAPTDFRQRAHVWWAAQRWLAIHRDTARPGSATRPGTDR